MKVWIPQEQGRAWLGTLPEDALVEIYDGVSEPPSDPETVEFWIPPFLATLAAAPVGVLSDMRSLRVVQLLTAGAEVWIPAMPDGVVLCDAAGAHDVGTAEWVVTAVLSKIREFDSFARAQGRGEWTYHGTDELHGKRVLIVGAGSIGAAVAARLEPFGVSITRVARRARDGVHAVDALPDLLPDADVVVLLVPLTDATRGLVDAKFLTRMADGALLVNAARGAVVDTDALVAELATGRISAALDVTAPEPLPAGHPLWAMENVLLTPHVAGSVRGLPPRAYALAGEQLRRYAAGVPLVNVVTDGY